MGASNGLEVSTQVLSKPSEYRKWNIVWRNVIMLSLLHIGAVYGLYLYIFEAMWTTCLFNFLYGRLGGLGVTAGAHRLWSHRSYKARKPLEIILIIFNCIALQGSVITWARDHRMHHRYSETDADPHNATRGFFFSHVGCFCVRKHPDIKAKAHTVDMSDLNNNPLLQFQKKYYYILVLLISVIIPVYIPSLWGESLKVRFFLCFVFRYASTLQYTWLVNSAAHKWGSKPYDKNINPTENKLVSFFALGEGFHNYHHTYPWDYKTAELGSYTLNYSKFFIDMMAKVGWAYDLKTVPDVVVKTRMERTGGDE